jgi:O-antigen ligase
MSVPATLGRKPAAYRQFELMLAVLLGIIAASIALAMEGSELRWIVLPTIALTGAVGLLVLPNKERWVWGGLVLSLQTDLALRFLHGRAGSDGLAFPGTVLLGFALLGLWLGRRAFAPRRWRWSWGGVFAIPIGFYLATTCASLLFTTERFVGLTELLFDLELALVLLVAVNATRTVADLRRTVLLLLIAVGIQSVIYYFQSATGVSFTLAGQVLHSAELPRPGGTVSTVPAEFASFMIPILMIAVAQFLGRTQFWGPTKLAVLIAMGTFAIVLTYTRAAWGAFVLGTAWIVVVGYRKRLVRARAVAFVGAAAVVGAVAAAPMIAMRMQSSPIGDSYAERAALMAMATRIIKAEPVLGVGPGAYGQVYRRYLTAEDEMNWLWIVHNRYLLRAAETGIPGGIALVLMFVTALRLALRLVRARDPFIATFALGVSGGLVAMLWEMYWDTFQMFPYNGLLWLLFGLLAAARRIERESLANSPVAT